MKDNVIKSKSFEFALRIVKLSKLLIEGKREYVISKQLIRSGTAIGALVREAEQAERKKDFIHKLSIALKEANETEYWIELLYKSHYLDEPGFNSMYSDLNELLKLLTAIIKTSKKQLAVGN